MPLPHAFAPFLSSACAYLTFVFSVYPFFYSCRFFQAYNMKTKFGQRKCMKVGASLIVLLNSSSSWPPFAQISTPVRQPARAMYYSRLPPFATHLISVAWCFYRFSLTCSFPLWLSLRTTACFFCIAEILSCLLAALLQRGGQ